jgi:hypothetical protein
MKASLSSAPRVASLLLGGGCLLLAIYVGTTTDVFSFKEVAEILLYSGLGSALVGDGLDGARSLLLLSKLLVLFGGALPSISLPLFGVHFLAKQPDGNFDNALGVALIVLGVAYTALWVRRGRTGRNAAPVA